MGTGVAHLRPDDIAFFPQMRQRSIHIDGVPEDDYVDTSPSAPLVGPPVLRGSGGAVRRACR